MSYFVGLRCTVCNHKYSLETAFTVCPNCQGILDPIYDLKAIKKDLSIHSFTSRRRSMWRWREFLPLVDYQNVITAHEGGTPLIKAKRLGSHFGVSDLYIKDETKNPTGTFKDRGASTTISRIKELDITKITIPSEGNAACSFALYTRIAGIQCDAFIPQNSDIEKQFLIRALGGNLSLVMGSISDAGQKASVHAIKNSTYNAATFMTPYRHDGKGTMALEICEQLKWEVPDVIIYPIGGGVGLIGMWKAFQILSTLGWTNGLPRMIGVQSENCAPVVRAFVEGEKDVIPWKNPKTVASGLRVPKPLAGKWILEVLRQSNGYALTISEEQIGKSSLQVVKNEGVIIEPSSAVAFAALKPLLDEGMVSGHEKIVIPATGSGLKSLQSGT